MCMRPVAKVTDRSSPASMLQKPSALVLALILLASAGWAGARQPELLLPLSSKPPCQGRNLRLSSYIASRATDSQEQLLPHRAKDYDAFVLEVKKALDSHMLKERAVDYVFSDGGKISPTCAGTWAEFGVAAGSTINLAARFRRDHCSDSCPPVYGFDTFTGLPEKWVRDDNSHWDVNHFDQKGLPKVEPNVHLVKGLFNESLPQFLAQQAIYASTDDVVSYLHIDCDLYAGSRDALSLLAPKLAVGTVIVFDDVVNYQPNTPLTFISLDLYGLPCVLLQYFRDHELKAMWEWLTATGTRLLPIGMKGPLPGKDYAVELDWSSGEGAAEWFHQSAAFVIAQQAHYGSFKT